MGRRRTWAGPHGTSRSPVGGRRGPPCAGAQRRPAPPLRGPAAPDPSRLLVVHVDGQVAMERNRSCRLFRVEQRADVLARTARPRGIPGRDGTDPRGVDGDEASAGSGRRGDRGQRMSTAGVRGTHGRQQGAGRVGPHVEHLPATDLGGGDIVAVRRGHRPPVDGEHGQAHGEREQDDRAESCGPSRDVRRGHERRRRDAIRAFATPPGERVAAGRAPRAGPTSAR